MLAAGPRTRTVAVLSALAVSAAACSSVNAPASSDELSDAFGRHRGRGRVHRRGDPLDQRADVPVPGSDGKYHVAYDLSSPTPPGSRRPSRRSMSSTAGDPTKVIASFSGTQLVDPDCPIGDCNRLRLLPSCPAAEHRIPPQETRALLVDFAFDSLDAGAQGGDAPPLRHGRRRTRAARRRARRLPGGAVRHLGGHAAGDRPAGEGRHWVALNGCCEPGFPHRTSLASLNGELINSQRFAIDWKQVNDEGEFYAVTRPRTRATSTTARTSTPSPTAPSSPRSTSSRPTRPACCPPTTPCSGHSSRSRPSTATTSSRTSAVACTPCTPTSKRARCT